MPKSLYALRLDDELLAALRRLAARDGIPVSAQIRRGVAMWLRSKGITTDAKKKVRETR